MIAHEAGGPADRKVYGQRSVGPHGPGTEGNLMATTSLVRRIGAGAVISVAFVAALASADSDSGDDSSKPAAESSDGGSETTISKGAGSSDASADVSAPTLVENSAMGIQEAKVTITNNSTGTSDYFVTVAAESPDGATRFDETIVAVMKLEPGQSTEESGMFTKDIPADAVLVVKEVQRTASL